MLTLKARKNILSVMSIVFVLVGLYFLVFFAEHLPVLSSQASCILIFVAVVFFAVAYLFMWCKSFIQ